MDDHLRNALERLMAPLPEVTSYHPVGGGCINNGARVCTVEGDFFVKWNDAHLYPKMFEREAAGLGLLRGAGSVRVPDLVGVTEEAGRQYILMEYIRAVTPQANYWNTLGRALAFLHRNTSSKFGLETDNYIGSLKQSNRKESNWNTFFEKERLVPQLKLLRDKGELDNNMMKRYESAFKCFENMFPVEPPALLHGDLWSGNVMTDENGEPYVIDPAVYYGHREAELAFTTLFGGFSQEFYSAYQEEFPLEPGFDDRADVYNLYPLLVHANLFGGGYLRQANTILKRLM